MLEASLKWRGDTAFVHEAKERAGGKGVEKNAVNPWRKWLTETRILAMYRDQGKVRAPGGAEGKRWPKNAPLTREIKGHGRPMLSQNQFRFGSMARSYVVDADVTFQGLRVSARLWNRARSDEGFDYPSHLDQGGKKTIRPINAKVLHAAGPGGEFFFRKASPAPKREHIFFTNDDVEQLGLRIAEWILDGRSRSHRRRVPR